jgi:acetoacetyl-CoA synthetase
MKKFLLHVSRSISPAVRDWSSLYKWSIDNFPDFWRELSQFVELKFQVPPKSTFKSGATMRHSCWFEDAALNFAENLLPSPDDQEVMVSIAEGTDVARWTGLQLWNDVARCTKAMRDAGVTENDRVAGVLINGPEAVICMLATASLGAIWASCSPDFGSRGISDRLNQIEPKLVFATESYSYAGKNVKNLQQTIDALRSLKVSPRVIAVDHFHRGTDQFSDFLKSSGLPEGSKLPLEIEFVPRKFQDPQYILFSSGTTGLPKCIVHGVGGTLLQHKKELMLHSDIKPGDTLLYFTTCGWMMWNWMVSALACGARVVTFDGAPGFPDIDRLWNLCRDEQVTHFGTSPKFISACMQADGFLPSKGAGLPFLRTILSTGSPLLPAHFEWVYKHFPNIHLASISGGTDIISCFMLGNPMLPVYAGEIQGPGLGMAIQSWNANGQPVSGEKGELVCVKPFVSMPVFFWHDEDGSRYRKAYFDSYGAQDVWRHGDFVEFTGRGGVIVYGRSDATLNPGGVRIGTAEIYRAVETLPFIADSVAIGQIVGDDTRIVLFVKLSSGNPWRAEMVADIKQAIRNALTPRHVPHVVLPVSDIPYTRSGKKVEIAVTQIIHGEDVPNKDALANPDCLAEFMAIRERLKS